MPGKSRWRRTRSGQGSRAIHVHPTRSGPLLRIYRHESGGAIRASRSLSERVSPAFLGAALLCDFAGEFHPGRRQDPDSWIAAGSEIAKIWSAVSHDLAAATEDYGEHRAEHSPPASTRCTLPGRSLS